MGKRHVLFAGRRWRSRGQIVGSTTDKGESPKERPITPGDIHATIYHVLGVDPTANFLDHTGRPVPIIDSGEVIRELI